MNRHCIIIGAMKCGTTSLFHSLSEHPSLIHASRVKDTRFFIDRESGIDLRKGLDWYLSLFPRSGGIKLEAPTHYTKYPDYHGVAARIKQGLRDVKLIYLVRDPLDRAISHFFHNLLVDRESLDINAAFSASGNKYLYYSDYALQLSQYYDYFSPEKLITVNLIEEDNRSEFLEGLARFLEMENLGCPLVVEKKNTIEDNFMRAPTSIGIDPNIIHHSVNNIEWALKFWLSRNTLTRIIQLCSEQAVRFQPFYPFSVESWLNEYKNYL